MTGSRTNPALPQSILHTITVGEGPQPHNSTADLPASAESMHRPDPASRPFVLATLRALRLDPGPYPMPPTRRPKISKTLVANVLTEPRPFRDDKTQRNPGNPGGRTVGFTGSALRQPDIGLNRRCMPGDTGHLRIRSHLRHLRQTTAVKRICPSRAAASLGLFCAARFCRRGLGTRTTSVSATARRDQIPPSAGYLSRAGKRCDTTLERLLPPARFGGQSGGERGTNNPKGPAMTTKT